MGSTIGPLEEKEGYDKNYSVAVNVASAPVGMLIPPSNTMIVYSSIAGSVSIAHFSWLVIFQEFSGVEQL